MSFIDSFKTAQQKFLRPSLFLLVAAVAVYPLVPSQTYKYVALYVLANAIIRFALDMEANLTKKLNSTHDDFSNRLSAVEDRMSLMQSHLQGPNPPTWENYTSSQSLILNDIHSAFERGDDVTLDIIGVSARYSWRMVEDQLGPVIKKYDHRKLTVNVAVCTEEILGRWSLNSWTQDLKRTVSGMTEFGHIHHEAVEDGRLILRRYEFDTLPQWHGVLINSQILYMGRTEWLFHDDSPPTMKVGQCPYRKFEPTDRYGGQPRIKMFSNWMERMRKRHDELHGTNA